MCTWEEPLLKKAEASAVAGNKNVEESKEQGTGKVEMRRERGRVLGTDPASSPHDGEVILPQEVAQCTGRRDRRSHKSEEQCL